jgi:uncharacterized damage-inducible protein DinB
MVNTSESLLAEFVRYNTWANLRLLEACQSLTDEQLNTSAVGTYGTIRDTWTHLIRNEGFYALLLTQQRIEPAFRWEDNPTLSALQEFDVEVGNALAEVAVRLKPTDLVHQEWQGKVTTYKAIAVLIQLVNHGVEHRAHINTILSQLNLVTSEVDGWSYMWANTDRFGVTSVDV